MEKLGIRRLIWGVGTRGFCYDDGGVEYGSHFLIPYLTFQPFWFAILVFGGGCLEIQVLGVEGIGALTPWEDPYWHCLVRFFWGGCG